MSRSVLHRLILSLSAALVVAVGLMSAQAMAPDRDALARAAALAAIGADPADICGDTAAHDHRCPVCTQLAGTPDPAPTGWSERIAWPIAAPLPVRRIADASAPRAGFAARAPPRRA